jgi:hypothetical protein
MTPTRIRLGHPEGEEKGRGAHAGLGSVPVLAALHRHVQGYALGPLEEGAAAQADNAHLIE